MNIAKFLKEQNVEFQLVPHRETYDAQRMAQAIGVAGCEVAKTVLLKVAGDHVFVVAVLPADKTIDLDRASQILGEGKLALATEPEISQHCPDCEVGVLPPFGSKYKMLTIVDANLAKEEEIVFEGNTHHEAIRMKFADFRRIEEPRIGSFVKEG